MIENTHLSNSIDAIEQGKLKYDKNVKELLADIQVLSRIVKYTVDEVRELTIEEIMQCIDERSIRISSVPVPPGLTNMGKVESKQTEDSVPNEGYIIYDIRFDLYYKNKELKIIVNVEAQKSIDANFLKYHIENRIVFYMARLVSAQKEREFFNSNYDDIKKVYSIWICMDAGRSEDSITEISLHTETIFGNPVHLPEIDKMRGYIIRIRRNEDVEKSKHILIAMLEDLLKKEPPEKKKKNLTDAYGMIMTPNIERRVDEMCNLSSVIDEMANKRGQEEGKLLTLYELVQKGKLTVFDAAEEVLITEKEFIKGMKTAGYTVPE